MSVRRLAGWAVAAVLAAVALIGLALAARPAPSPLADRVTQVAAGLRCPTCAGQSVADSESDGARQMRVVIERQLSAGRTPDEVRDWFAARYGDGVLLDPPWRGAGLVARMVPVVVLLAGAAALAGTYRRGYRGVPQTARPPVPPRP